MSDNVTQQLRIVGSEAQKAVEHLAGPDSAVDFEKIIPIPPDLNIEFTYDGHMGLAAITGNCRRYLELPWIKEQGIATAAAFKAHVERERPHAIELARKYLSNKEKYGHMDWEDWCLENWGTRWNAYSVGEWERLTDRASIRFNTASFAAIRIVEKLSQSHPFLAFELRYLDDGLAFAGEAFFSAGEYTGEHFRATEGDQRIHRIYRVVYGKDAAVFDVEQ